MKRTITLKGVDFEIIDHPTKKAFDMLRNASQWWENFGNRPRSIYEAYDKPSWNKIRIFRQWYDYFYDLVDYASVKAFEIRIVSHNCQFFSIACRMDDTLLYITPKHRYLIVLDKEMLSMLNEPEKCSLFKGLL